MSYQSKILTEAELIKLFEIEEDHFNDFKAKDISGKGLSKTISAFANASGGDIYIGIREEKSTKIKYWEGFRNIEEANPSIQVIESLPAIESYFEVDFLRHPTLLTYIVKISIFKSRIIVKTTDDKRYVRRGAPKSTYRLRREIAET